VNKVRFIRVGIFSFLASLLVIFIYGYFVPSAPVFGKVYFRGNTSENAVALTFDDGPNEPYTSMVLDVLAQHNIKATFFLIGSNVERYPDTARRILDEGHVIGNHSYSHNANHALIASGSKDVIKAQEAIFGVTGVYPALYRPPHGRTSPWQLFDLKQARIAAVTWDVTTAELRGHSSGSMAQDIIDKARPDSIILLHDGYGTFSASEHIRAEKSKTAEAVDIIIETLLGMDYSFLTVSKLLNISPYQPN
jgi:peptidoglycan/xylan/chitin deacetylase (PgdA/CDA1 family)